MPTPSLWSPQNLLAWEIVPWDANERSPHQRAEMLQRLGLRAMAYDWRAWHVQDFETEIEALRAHQVKLAAWWFPAEPDEPLADHILDVLRRHGETPDLWVTHSTAGWQPVRTAPGHVPMPAGRDWATHVPAFDLQTRRRLHRQQWDSVAGLYRATFPSGPASEEVTLEREVNRIEALVRMAKPAGCRVQLYTHNGWFGMTDNLVAITERLAHRGIDEVGIVYNFHHALDSFHDDPADFDQLWSRMMPHVSVVNINGIAPEGELMRQPSQGHSELDMMRIIQNSGWNGQVGVTAEIGGDVEHTLADALTGLWWLESELASPGTNGPPPRLTTGDPTPANR